MGAFDFVIADVLSIQSNSQRSAPTIRTCINPSCPIIIIVEGLPLSRIAMQIRNTFHKSLHVIRELWEDMHNYGVSVVCALHVCSVCAVQWCLASSL